MWLMLAEPEISWPNIRHYLYTPIEVSTQRASQPANRQSTQHNEHDCGWTFPSCRRANTHTYIHIGLRSAKQSAAYYVVLAFVAFTTAECDLNIVVSVSLQTRRHRTRRQRPQSPSVLCLHSTRERDQCTWYVCMTWHARCVWRMPNGSNGGLVSAAGWCVADCCRVIGFEPRHSVRRLSCAITIDRKNYLRYRQSYRGQL